MRGLIVAAIVAVGLLFGSSALARECTSGAGGDALGAQVVVTGRCPNDPEPEPDIVADADSEAQPVAGGVVQAAPPRVFEPVLGVREDSGEACIRLVDRSAVDPDEVLVAAWEQRTLAMLSDLLNADSSDPWCDAASAEAAGVSPVVAADGFVRSIPLPTPDIHIAPGWAMTGMPAYLEVRGQETFGVSEALPGWGALQVSLRPVAVEVDWGDGTVVLEQGRLGSPWDGDPAQQVVHTYIDADESTVVQVAVLWSAEWSLGAAGGIIDGLRVETSYPLPVREYRAVRVAP